MGIVLSKKSVSELRGSLHGEVVLPGDKDYDTGRRVWNGMIDRRPSLIVYCVDTGDVITSPP